jgi:hypothetical protein
VENCPRHAIEEQYGAFDSWTLANAFACKLNEGLGIDPLEVRLLVTESILLRDNLLHSRCKSCGPWCVFRNRPRGHEHEANLALADPPPSMAPCASAGKVALR